MKQVVIVLIMCCPLLVNGQDDSLSRGIGFEENLSWHQVLDKAREENKYIFVDCFATWCGPCRKMDNEVYNDKKVGVYVNERFISIKVQEDTSENDNEQIKSWYTDAHRIMQKYKVRSFPTFLFFSSDSKIVHRATGFKDRKDFATLIAKAIDPNKQYYTLMRNYKNGKKDYRVMPYLVETSRSLNEDNMANIITNDYLQNYLYRLNGEDLYTKEHIEFMTSSIKNSKGKAFIIFYRHSKKIDQVMKRNGYSQDVVDYFITKDEIEPSLFRDRMPINENPNWNKIAVTITRKYNKFYAERNILNAQIRWYNYKRDWLELTKCEMSEIDKYGLDTVSFWGKIKLNDIMYNVIFKHCDDTLTLNKAIKWMEVLLKAVNNDEYDIDTYANLLYKVGRTNEALLWEKKAAASGDKEIIANYKMMERGEKTW